MGGTISFLYAGAFPKIVARLILVEGIGPIGLHFSDAPGRMAQWLAQVRALEQRRPAEYASLEEAAKRLQGQNPRLRAELALHLARSGMRRSEGGKWLWKFDPLHRTSAPQPFYTGQALEFLRRIECPVLMVQGKESRQTPRPDVQERSSAIARHTTAEIKDAGHMVHQDNPEALAEVVLEFLNR